MLLKRQHNLPTLALALDRPLDRSASRGQAVFTLLVGDTTIDQVSVPTAELNLPANLRELSAYQYHDPPYSIPASLIARLQAKLPTILPPGAPLWLLFETSAGFLPLAPWEKLLQPLLGVPLLRIPNFLINPLADPHALDVAICASSPVTEPAFPIDEVLVRIASQLLQTVQRRVRIDMFADARAHNNLQARVDAAGIGAQVRVHNPWDAKPRRARSSAAQNAPGAAWLEWIGGALEGRSIDLAYFVGHGCLADNNGLLLLAESPTRNQDREIFIGAQQLDSFLSSAGAWAAVFSAPPQNYSGSGLRLLAGQLARTRPGPLLLHDFADDQNCDALAAAFRFLFNNSGVAPASPAISLYCHPDTVRPEVSDSYGIEPTAGKLGQLTLAHNDECRQLLQTKDKTPGWLAKSQRVLERSVAELDRTAPFEETRSATRAGSERALSFVADVLARYATAQPSDPSEQPADKEPAQ
jgi:hypothetical protein